MEENLISKRRKILRKWIITADALLRILFICVCLINLTVRLWYTTLNVKWVNQTNWNARGKMWSWPNVELAVLSLDLLGGTEEKLRENLVNTSA